MNNSINNAYRGTETYLTEDHHGYVKENFRSLAELIQKKLDEGILAENASVLDVGCATGALIGFLSSIFSEFTFHGMDVSNELIGIAKQKIQTASFEVGSILDIADMTNGKFDLILCIGVMGIFDEHKARTCLQKLIDLGHSGTIIYVFSQFNEFNVDVMVKHRLSGWDGWGTGWNIFSYSTIDGWIQNLVQGYRFIEFEMPFQLNPQENPVRTWTVDMLDGRKRLTNGLKLLVDLRFLEVIV